MACVSTMSSAPKEDASTASGCPAAICAKLSCNAAHRLETVDGGIEKETALMACSCLCTTGNKEHSLTGRRALWNDLKIGRARLNSSHKCASRMTSSA